MTEYVCILEYLYIHTYMHTVQVHVYIMKKIKHDAENNDKYYNKIKITKCGKVCQCKQQ